jgi:Leucine-rich repeat (LRR) protein
MAFRLGIRRRWLRISTRTLLLIVLVISVVLGYVSHRARKQEELVRRLLTEGRGKVGYRHAWDEAGKRIPNAATPGPAWLRRLIGEHAFLQLHTVLLTDFNEDDLRLISEFPSIEVLSLPELARDEGMPHIARLRNLKKLYLSSPLLTDRGIEYLAGLHNLEKLILMNARLTDDGLKHLANLTRLKELILDNTQVTADGVGWLRKRLPDVEIIPESFASAPEERKVVQQLIKSGAIFVADKEGYLEQVTFYGKDVGDEQLSALESLKRLEQLTVMYTRVTDAGIQRLLRTLPKLTVSPPFREPLAEEADAVSALRQVGGNVLFDPDGHVTTFESFDENLPVESLAPAATLRKLKFMMLTVPRLDAAECRTLGAIESLEKLWATNASITDSGVEHLGRLVKLKTIWTEAANVSDDGLAHFGDLPALETLWLGRVAIRGPGLARLTNVTSLLLSFQASAGLSDEGLAYVAGLAQLRSLTLDFTEISDDGLVHLRKLANLERLSLQGSRITDAGLLQLAEFSKLKSLNVRDSEVTAEGVEEFKKLRPGCKVSR